MLDQVVSLLDVEIGPILFTFDVDLLHVKLVLLL